MQPELANKRIVVEWPNKHISGAKRANISESEKFAEWGLY